MEHGPDIVIEGDNRPAGHPDVCFYCHAMMGAKHNEGCVCLYRTIPPIYEKFENWHLQYRVEPNAIDAEVYEEYIDGPTNELKQKKLADLLVKWDGCSHLRLEYFHFDGIEQWAAFDRVVRYISNDVCERHGVTDG